MAGGGVADWSGQHSRRSKEDPLGFQPCLQDILFLFKSHVFKQQIHVFKQKAKIGQGQLALNWKQISTS